MKCKEKAGFLIAHPCTSTAELNCCVCGKDVCNDHARETDGGFASIECFKKQRVDDDVAASNSRRSYYHDPYYYGYYHSYHPYHMHDSFDDGDREAFETSDTGDAGAVEADADGS